MGWFKRLCLFVYGLAGILALLALSLPWVGPYTQQATDLIYVPEYFRVLEVLVGITGVGCLICFLRSIFTPRNYKNIIISSDGGDQITVTRSAIASQAEHIVERDGSCVAGTVRVRAKKRGSIRVFVRVTPKRPLDVVEKGEQLHAELDEGLAKIAADKIKSVNLEFTDPQEMDAADEVTTTPLADDVSYEPATSVNDITSAPLDEGEPTTDSAENGITVSMSSFHRPDARPDETSSLEEDGSQDPTTTLPPLGSLGTGEDTGTEEPTGAGEASDGTAEAASPEEGE